MGKKNTGKRLASHTIHTSYANYKKERFPRLLDDPMVPEEDKRKIRDLLKKPWNPYIRRHTAATEISKTLKDSVLIDQYMGWSHAGNTRQKYQHYYNDDSFDAMLTMMDGLKPISLAASGKTLLKPRLCPNCSETNTPESRFCTKCKFVLTFDAYNETIADAERAKEEQQKLKTKLDDIYGMSIKHWDKWSLFLKTFGEAMKNNKNKKKSNTNEALLAAFNAINEL